MANIGAHLERGARLLGEAGIENPRAEARLLLSHAAGITRERMIGWPEEEIPAEAAERFAVCLERRCVREPLAYITGIREFWSLDIHCAPGALIPRPETELLVEAALAALPVKDAEYRIADIGTGTGCIPVAFLTERPEAHAVAVDISPQALAVAARNRDAHGLADRMLLVNGSFADALAPGLDAIVSNPPYIPDAEVSGLMPEVSAHEPTLALAGGVDGLDPYTPVFKAAMRVLKPGGFIGVEHGTGQGDAVRALAGDAGLEDIVQAYDLSGKDRFVTARRP